MPIWGIKPAAGWKFFYGPKLNHRWCMTGLIWRAAEKAKAFGHAKSAPATRAQRIVKGLSINTKRFQTRAAPQSDRKARTS